MKHKINILPGFHVPFEYCDKCVMRCESYGRTSKRIEAVNRRREEIVKYLKQLGFSVYTHASPPDMRSVIGFVLSMFSKESIEPLGELILHLAPGKEMVITILYDDIEKEWYDELKKEGKISAVLKMMK